MILFVDDEPLRIQSYVDELDSRGYDVLLRTDVDSARRVMQDGRERVELVILDIMMPPGAALTWEQTGCGLKTGLHLYREIRMEAPELPVIILTNVPDEEVAD